MKLRRPLPRDVVVRLHVTLAVGASTAVAFIAATLAPDFGHYATLAGLAANLLWIWES